MYKYEIENDIVLGKFINYMQKALLHRKLNYIRNKEKILEMECSINELDNVLQTKEKEEFTIIDILTPKEKLVLNLHLNQKLTYQEISSILNLKPESIRKIQYRAIKKLESRGEYENKN